MATATLQAALKPEFPLEQINNLTHNLHAISDAVNKIPDSHGLSIPQSDALDRLRSSLTTTLSTVISFIDRYA